MGGLLLREPLKLLENDQTFRETLKELVILIEAVHNPS